MRKQQMRNVMMVGATFLLAAATGHVMQNTSGDVSLGADVAVHRGGDATPLVRPGATTAAVPVTGARISNVAELPQLPLRRMVPDQGAPLVPHEQPVTTGFASACAPADLTLSAAPQASILVDLHAPCNAGQLIEVRHQGLRFTASLDAQGDWQGLLPALASQAAVTALLPDGAQVGASVAVPGLDAFNRIVLSWQGPGDMHLNVFEYGAEFGGAGHISADTPRSPDTPLGGYMLAFGSQADGAKSEVYSAPATMTDLRLELDAPVGVHSCGRDLSGSLQRSLATTLEAPTPLVLSLPECGDAVGDVVMALPDLPMSLAAN